MTSPPDPRPETLDREARTIAEFAFREFVDASVAVWREIDRLGSAPEGYRGLHSSTELRKREKAAWERYRDIVLDVDDEDAAWEKRSRER